MKKLDWFLVIVIVLAFAFEVGMVYKSMSIVKKDHEMIESVICSIQDSVWNDVKSNKNISMYDTIEPWCKMYYYGNRKVRVMYDGKDTILENDLNVSIDNWKKEITLWNCDKIQF